MVSAKEVSAQKLIDSMVPDLKKIPDIKIPEWAYFVKTGTHAQRKPENPDWWYVRCSSILRRLYVEGNLGVGTMRSWYGGAKNRGSRPERHTKASGHILRTCLQQLEKAGYVKKEKVGRLLTSEGRSFIDKHVVAVKPKRETKPFVKEKAVKIEKKAEKKTEKKTEKKAEKTVEKEVKTDESGKSSGRPAKKITGGTAKKTAGTKKASSAKKPAKSGSKGKADKDKPSKSGAKPKD